MNTRIRNLAAALLALASQAAAVPAWSATELEAAAAEAEDAVILNHGDRGNGRGRDARTGNDFVSRTLYQRFTGVNVLHLRQLLNLGQEHRGRRIEYVMLTGSTAAGHGQAQLLINNQAVGASQTVGTWTQDYFLYTDSYRDEMDTEIQTLQIQLTGNFNVQSVAVKFAPDWGGGQRDMVRVPVNQYFQGRTMLSVRQMLNLGYQYQGRAVESVILTGRTNHGRGTAALRVNGMQVGYDQQVGTWSQDYAFFVDAYRNRLDYDINTLELELQGQFTVDFIAVKFARGNGGGYPTPTPPAPPAPYPPAPPVPAPGNSVVTVRLGQDFNGNTDLNLRQIMNLYAYEGRRVESVSLLASTDAGRGQAQLVTNGIEQGLAQTVGTQLGNYSFYLGAGSNILGRDLYDLTMRLRGRFRVESITVTFARY